MIVLFTFYVLIPALALWFLQKGVGFGQPFASVSWRESDPFFIIAFLVTSPLIYLNAVYHLNLIKP